MERAELSTAEVSVLMKKVTHCLEGEILVENTGRYVVRIKLYSVNTFENGRVIQGAFILNGKLCNPHSR